MNENDFDLNKLLFAQLIAMLAQGTLQHLGKIMNPMTNKAEVNLEAAQATIDMLDMLEARTKGNLDKDEAAGLRDTISMLKMNFVETANASPAPAAAGEIAPEAPTATATDVPPPPPAGDDKTRYRKSYG